MEQNLFYFMSKYKIQFNFTLTSLGRIAVKIIMEKVKLLNRMQKKRTQLSITNCQTSGTKIEEVHEYEGVKCREEYISQY